MIVKTFHFLWLLAFLLVAIPISVQADEEARYNFASAQGDKVLKIQPGNEGIGYIYFYNIDGNRITHITLAVNQSPINWSVSVDPPLSKTQVLVNGSPIPVTENLYIEPSELFVEEPQNVPEGIFTVKVTGRGYALSKRVMIRVKIPPSVPLGTSENITISAEAVWLGQSGAATVKQVRNFDFTVIASLESNDYSEEIINKSEINRLLPAIIIGVSLLLCLVVLIPLFSRKKSRVK